MKIEKINYSKLLTTGVYSNERIGFEASIDEGEDILISIEKLRIMAEESHKEKYPYLYTSNGSPVTIEQVPDTIIDPKERQIHNFIEAIETSTSKKAVEIFRKLVERENNPQLTEAFDNKLKELS